jgi:hypothetical protein
VKRFIFLGLTVGAIALAASSASAGTIFDTGTTADTGVGFGTVKNLLTLQNDPTEIGSVGWDGTDPVYTGDADTNAGKSFPFLVSDVTSDPTRLALIFNISEAGNPKFVTLNSLVATFFNSAGGTVATATWPGPSQDYDQVGGGVGGAGQLFTFSFSPAEITAISAAGVRIGLAASISSASNGPETFYIAEGGIGGLPVPLPAAAWSGLALLAMLGVVAKLRRRGYA